MIHRSIIPDKFDFDERQLPQRLKNSRVARATAAAAHERINPPSKIKELVIPRNFIISISLEFTIAKVDHPQYREAHLPYRARACVCIVSGQREKERWTSFIPRAKSIPKNES